MDMGSHAVKFIAEPGINGKIVITVDQSGNKRSKNFIMCGKSALQKLEDLQVCAQRGTGIGFFNGLIVQSPVIQVGMGEGIEIVGGDIGTPAILVERIFLHKD